MNKIKGSIIAKVIAWALLIASGIAFIFCCVAAGVMEGEGIFTQNYEEVREQEFDNVVSEYSLLVLSNLQDGKSEKTKDYFANKSFRYGVIKAESLDGLDLDDDKIYVERNFTDSINKENMYTFSMNLSEDTVFSCHKNGVFGNSYYYSIDGNEKTMYVDSVCYDKTGGIFYYHANDKYYPVEQVMITAAFHTDDGVYDGDYYFEYDSEKKKYINQNYTGESEIIESDNHNTAIKKADRALQLLYHEEELTFNQFDGTDFSYMNWMELCFDNVRYLNGSSLTIIDSENIPENSFMQTTSYLDENDTLHVWGPDKGDSYFVVSFVDEETLAKEKQDYVSRLMNKGWDGKLMAVLMDNETDRFVLNELLLDGAYEIKNQVLGMAFCNFILAFGCFIFLMCGAGHRRNREELVITFVDKIPFDVLCVLTGAICFLLAAIMDTFCYSDSVYFILNMGLFIGIIVLCTLLTFALSFAVRVKNGKWWRNSIIYKIYAKIKEILGSAMRHTKLVWKVVLLMAVYTVAEFIILYIFYCGADYEGLIAGLCLEKIVITGFLLYVINQFKTLQEGSRRLAEGNLTTKIDTSKMLVDFKQHGENLNRIGEGISRAVDERMKSEHFKTELITNVSHDIKTPLTSIINYVDLLEKTEIQDETQKEYLEVLERQSARLKKLIEDLIEASKASTGNLPVNIERLEADVFLTQIAGEFEEKLAVNHLELILGKPEETVYLNADGRHLWRVVDNLMNNICKYAQPDSRVYINLESDEKQVTITFRNMSRYPLNISSDELMERFVRGDSSRNTEGNGLGLSIASSLMELMKGKLTLYVDGDLFKVVLTFPQNCSLI